MKTLKSIRWMFVVYAVLTTTIFLITPLGLAIILAEGDYSLAFMLIFFTLYMARELIALRRKNTQKPEKSVIIDLSPPGIYPIGDTAYPIGDKVPYTIVWQPLGSDISKHGK